MPREEHRRRDTRQRRRPDRTNAPRPIVESQPSDPREKARRAQLAAQKKKARRQAIVTLMSIFAVIVFVGVLIFLVAKDSQNNSAKDSQLETKPVSQRVKRDPITKIHIRAAGDLNVTNSVVQSGLAAVGYDFTKAFQDVAPLLTEADCTILNLEGNLAGEPYGTETASAPAQLLTAIRAAGVDFVQMANSYSIYNGLIGLRSTLASLRAAGLEPIGAYGSEADYRSGKGYTMCEIQGVKVALVAFTKGLGGMGLPEGSENCVNILYEDYNDLYKKVNTEKITAVLKAVEAEKPDITIAMLHWGSEGNDSISKTQESIVSLMKKRGVDVIIGSHPHLVHKIEYDESAGTLVAYSLGDFYGNGTIGGSNYSIILDVEITKDADLGVTKVTGYSYTPIYTLKPNECDGYQKVIRIKEAMDAYKGNYVDKVTAGCYAQLEKSLGRIEDRVSGKDNAEKAK